MRILRMGCNFGLIFETLLTNRRNSDECRSERFDSRGKVTEHVRKRKLRGTRGRFGSPCSRAVSRLRSCRAFFLQSSYNDTSRCPDNGTGSLFRDMQSDSSLPVAETKLRLILEKAGKNGVSVCEIVRLPNGRRLCRERKENVHARRHVVAVVLGLLTAVAYLSDLYTREGFSRLWLRWKHGVVHGHRCTIWMPDELTKILRPPVHCSVCEGIDQVEKVANLTPELFEERYAYTGRPVVVTDGMVNWTAQDVFTFEFFKKIYERRMEQWSAYGCQFFPYDTEFGHLREVFNMSRERALMVEGSMPWYVGWSNCDDDVNQILRRHYERPYFLPRTSETKNLDWIFMGSTGYGAPMHVDNVGHPSWQAQLRGRKRWDLQPPPECFYTCDDLQVVVEPGEIIVLDTNRWYHSTLIISKEMSVTIGAEYD